MNSSVHILRLEERCAPLNWLSSGGMQLLRLGVMLHFTTSGLWLECKWLDFKSFSSDVVYRSGQLQCVSHATRLKEGNQRVGHHHCITWGVGQWEWKALDSSLQHAATWQQWRRAYWRDAIVWRAFRLCCCCCSWRAVPTWISYSNTAGTQETMGITCDDENLIDPCVHAYM